MIKLIVVKNDIFLGSGSIKAGVYTEQQMSRYPFLDLKNKDYFATVNYEGLPDGTKVIYNDQTYYTVFNLRDLRAKFVISRGGNIQVDVAYELYKSMTNPKSKLYTPVYESKFEVCQFYFFINSEGAVCKAFNGQKPNADRWRKRIGNYFNTEQEAYALKEKLTQEDSQVKVNYEIIWTK